jgi:hypothetical protein
MGAASTGAARNMGAAATPAIARGQIGLRATARINPAAIISDLLGPQEQCLWRAPPGRTLDRRAGGCRQVRYVQHSEIRRPLACC